MSCVRRRCSELIVLCLVFADALASSSSYACVRRRCSKLIVLCLVLSDAVASSSSYVLCSQTAREQWSQTLWVNLNIQVLQDGIDGFIKTFRKLPKDTRVMSVGKALEDNMKEFRDSLPL